MGVIHSLVMADLSSRALLVSGVIQNTSLNNILTKRPTIFSIMCQKKHLDIGVLFKVMKDAYSWQTVRGTMLPIN
jgi:hypothetical protein